MTRSRFLSRWLVVPAVAVGAIAPTSMTEAQSASDTTLSAPRQLEIDYKQWTGDFDGMLERRHIRVLVPYSRTLFFLDKGRERGLSAELARDFERYLNEKHAKQLSRRPLTISLVPTTRDKLLTNLAAGLGDISAGNLTATESRMKTVDFVAPTDRKAVQEVLVSGPHAPAITSLDDLSEKTLHVRVASSYFESLVALGARLRGESKKPVQITLLPDALEDEDVLEMLNAGLFDFTVVDSWKAKMWAQILPKIQVREDVVLRSEGYTGWAIRKQSPELRAEIEGFYRYSRKHGIIETRLANYQKRIKQISNNTTGAAWQRFEKTLALFEKYGEKYGFDPLMLVAQGFQESKLDQNAKSGVGAVGVMQIMPATGAEMKVGDIHQLEANIHAGAKYMDQLMTRYFQGAKFSEAERPLFAFAAYNAGPGNIGRMRKAAAERGLDPDRWFNNVELVTAEKIGMETTTYVRNIYKYYIAYKLTLEAEDARRKARESTGAGKS
jgi:membrane-bound lytic murein transglycosylase MltF